MLKHRVPKFLLYTHVVYGCMNKPLGRRYWWLMACVLLRKNCEINLFSCKTNTNNSYTYYIHIDVCTSSALLLAMSFSSVVAVGSFPVMIGCSYTRWKAPREPAWFTHTIKYLCACICVNVCWCKTHMYVCSMYYTYQASRGCKIRQWNKTPADHSKGHNTHT